MSDTGRLLKRNKTVQLVFTGLSADGMLSDGAGTINIPLDDINWQRIVVHGSVDVLTGTSVTFKAVTGNNPTAVLATTSVAAVKGDGSTAFVSASLTATGSFSFATTKRSSDGATASNIGQQLGFWADVTSVTVLTGTLTVYIEGT
jgi:hypothetical protein